MTDDLQRTPLAPRNIPAGAECIDVYGFAAPLVVTDPVEEYTAVREGVGVLDFSMLLKLDVRGPGALEVINSAVARDLTKVVPGRIAYGPVLDDNGLMQDDSTCFVFGDDHVRVIGGPGMPAAIRAVTDGTNLVVESLRESLAHFTIQGPRSRALLEKLTDADVSNEAFPYYTFSDDLVLAGVPTFVSRMGFTAELGYELYAPVDRALELWDAVFAAGEEFGIRALGAAAIMMVRIEAGMVMGEGLEYDHATSPWECNLGWAIPADKPSFRGREAVLAAKETAPRRTVTVRLDGGEDRATGAPLFVDGVEVGHVTMSIPSPHLGFATIGLAQIAKEHAAVGTAVTARLEEGDIAGKIIATPVYDPDRQRVRS